MHRYDTWAYLKISARIYLKPEGEPIVMKFWKSNILIHFAFRRKHAGHIHLIVKTMFWNVEFPLHQPIENWILMCSWDDGQHLPIDSSFMASEVIKNGVGGNI